MDAVWRWVSPLAGSRWPMARRLTGVSAPHLRARPTTDGCVGPAGRVLGGSTAINGMIYVRGQPRDFDEWADAGAEGWDWQSVAPFFDRFENHAGARVAGQLQLQQAKPSLWGERFIAACESAGIPRNDSYLTGDDTGRRLLPPERLPGVASECQGRFSQCCLAAPESEGRNGRTGRSL